MIYQEDSVVAAVRAVELISMLTAGPALARSDDEDLKALGNAIERIADARLRYMLGLIEKVQPSELERTAGEHASLIYAWLADHPKPEHATDELRAAVHWLDSQVMAGGIEGPGWDRELVRGEI